MIDAVGIPMPSSRSSDRRGDGAKNLGVYCSENHWGYQCPRSCGRFGSPENEWGTLPWGSNMANSGARYSGEWLPPKICCAI